MSSFKAGGLRWNPDARVHIRETSWEGWRVNCQAVEDSEEFLPENVRKSMLPDHDVQGRTSSCTGFGGTTVTECSRIRHDGVKLNLSQMFTYTRAQSYSNLLGSDQGASIDGVRKTLTQDGVVPQEAYKFTGKYYLPDRNEWPVLLAKARECVVPNTSQINNYDDCLNFTRSYGAVVIGSRFLQFMAESNKEVFDGWGAGDVGMHCYAIVGWSKRRAKDGRRFMYVANSWPSWGRNGVAEFSPKLIDNLYADKFTDSFGVTFRGPSDPSPVGLLSYRKSRRG